MRNGPSENHSHIKDNTEHKSLQNNFENTKMSPALQKTINSVLNILEKHPEKNKNIQEHFSQALKNITNNPETQKLLDQKILEKMKSNIRKLVEQYNNGEITKEEAIKLGKEVIQIKTKERLYILKQETELL